MREATMRPARNRLGLLLATLTLVTSAAAGNRTPPPAPEPPAPPAPPEVPVQGFTIRPGETHKGNVVRFAP
jgi:hypothetical protein